MNTLSFIIFLLSFPVILYFIIRVIMAYVKKDKGQRVKQLKLTGVSFAIMIVSFIVFISTAETIPEVEKEAKEIEKVEVSVPAKKEPKVVPEENKDNSAEEPVEEVSAEIDNKSELEIKAEKNAEANPAKPGAKLFGDDFKGMNYHLKGQLVKVEKVEGLFGEMVDALLVENEQGYVMPIFPPYEVTATIDDEIEVWGPLSGDGYASSDLGVDNVVGMTGAMNASLISINGEQQ